MSFKIKRLDDMIEEFENAEKNVKSELRKVCDKTMNSLHGRVKTYTPVDTGELKGNWKKEKLSPFEARVYNTTPYAVWVNYGHRVRGGSYFLPGVYMLERAIQDMKVQKDIDKAFDVLVNNLFKGGK